MNAKEQRAHRTRTAELSQGLEAIADATADELVALRTAIDQERAERRSAVDAGDGELRRCCQEHWDAQAQTNRRLVDSLAAFRDRGFWSRLGWLFRGR